MDLNQSDGVALITGAWRAIGFGAAHGGKRVTQKTLTSDEW